MGVLSFILRISGRNEEESLNPAGVLAAPAPATGAASSASSPSLLLFSANQSIEAVWISSRVDSILPIISSVSSVADWMASTSVGSNSSSVNRLNLVMILSFWSDRAALSFTNQSYSFWPPPSAMAAISR